MQLKLVPRRLAVLSMLAAEFANTIKSEMASLGKVIKTQGIRGE